MPSSIQVIDVDTNQAGSSAYTFTLGTLNSTAGIYAWRVVPVFLSITNTSGAGTVTAVQGYVSVASGNITGGGGQFNHPYFYYYNYNGTSLSGVYATPVGIDGFQRAPFGATTGNYGAYATSGFQGNGSFAENNGNSWLKWNGTNNQNAYPIIVPQFFAGPGDQIKMYANMNTGSSNCYIQGRFVCYGEG